MDMAEPEHQMAYDYRHLDRIRQKFRDVFGRECVLRDDALLQKYALSAEGDLIMFVR